VVVQDEVVRQEAALEVHQEEVQEGSEGEEHLGEHQEVEEDSATEVHREEDQEAAAALADQEEHLEAAAASEAAAGAAIKSSCFTHPFCTSSNIKTGSDIVLLHRHLQADIESVYRQELTMGKATTSPTLVGLFAPDERLLQMQSDLL
jgi:hypothetical protein